MCKLSAVLTAPGFLWMIGDCDRARSRLHCPPDKLVPSEEHVLHAGGGFGHQWAPYMTAMQAAMNYVHQFYTYLLERESTPATSITA